MAKIKKQADETETNDYDAPETAHVAPQATPINRTARQYRNEHELDHDLFKLKVAKMRKNVSYDPEDPIFELFEHCHIFHTIDSSGKKQTMCSPVGGHFHEIEVVSDTSGGVPRVVVSRAKKWALKKVGKNKVLYAVDCDEDAHVHDVDYLGSEKIKTRQMSPEFLKFEASFRAHKEPAAPEGTGEKA